MISYMSQTCYSLNSQVLAIFFPFATISATSHYPEFTDRYSPQYDRLSFSLYFITIPFFRLFFSHFYLVSQSHGWFNTVYATISDPTDKILVALPPTFPSYSPDLGCVGAQRIMLLDRFLVQPTHLLPDGPRPARIWLILDLTRNRRPD